MCVKCKMVILAFLILFLSACTKENKEAITESVPVYNRKTINLMLEENLNPYQMDYTENGIFYYVHDSNDESYHFYYQSYLEGEESIPIFTHEGGYVKGLSCVKKKDGLHFAVLWSGDGVYATEYLINGKEYSKVIIESDHAEGEKIPVFAALSNDEYLIGRDKTIYRVHSDGSMEEADPEIKLTGIPSSAGKRVVYMMLEQPMAILSSSECEREAFDFVLYYCRNCNTLGYSGGEVFEGDEQQATQTNAEFWIFEDYLKKEIWETEKPLLYVRNPGSAGFTVVYLSEDHKRMIRELMDQAVGVTKAQEDIYGMLLEEMDGYWNGNKDLNSACDALQSRVSLYLAE